MRYRYATADVFSTEPMRGNPVAVVLDAGGVDTAQMQAFAAEFNYVETTVVLPPADPSHTARVRIFTLDREVRFAGHPNIGTAFLLARERSIGGGTAPDRFLFEEEAGLVAIDLLREGEAIVGAELLSPQPLARSATVGAARAAACLGLDVDEVQSDTHPPQVVSVGLPFLVVELVSREGLRRARPDRTAYNTLFPLDGARSVYADMLGRVGRLRLAGSHVHLATGGRSSDGQRDGGRDRVSGRTIRPRDPAARAPGRRHGAPERDLDPQRCPGRDGQVSRRRTLRRHV